MRDEEEVNEAKKRIKNNKGLSYGYKEDAIAILDWVLDGDRFDGI